MDSDYVATNAEGKILSTGDKLTDFRGQEWTYIRISLLPQWGKSAKVYVQSADNENGQEFYAQVFGVNVYPVNFVEFEADWEHDGKPVMSVYWLRYSTPIPDNATESWADDNAIAATWKYPRPAEKEQ